MRGENSAIQEGSACLLAKRGKSNEREWGVWGEIAVHVLFLALLFALVARGWVYDLWFS